MNTVANTSRTACGYGCTCCLTQVLSNSHTLITEYSVHMKPLDSAAFQMHLFILLPPPPPIRFLLLPVSAAPNTWIMLSFSCLGLCTSTSLSSLSPFESFLCFFRDSGSSPALPLLSDDIISCRQAWVFCQCSEACVMARSQMCVQEHTVPKCRLNQT